MSEPLAHSKEHLLINYLQAVAALADVCSQFIDADEPTRRESYPCW